MQAHTALNMIIETYLDYVNNYLTIEKMAEHNMMNVEELRMLIEWGKIAHEKRVERYQIHGTT